MKPDAKTFGSGGPGSLGAQYKDKANVPAVETIVTSEEPTEDEQSADPNKFSLFGTDLFGDEIQQDKKGVIRERFEFPPFTVLNAREGAWQARKRAWLATGIQSELGRGVAVGTIPTSNTNLPEGQKGLSAGLAMNKGRPKDASPGGSARPAMDYKNKERGDGAGKAIPKGGLTWGISDVDEMRNKKNKKNKKATGIPGGGLGKNSAYMFKKSDGSGYERTFDVDGKYDRKAPDTRAIGTQGWIQDKIAEGDIDGGMSGSQSGTSIFDPTLTELMYRWFCPPGGLILDPFAGGSVRGIVAGLLGFRYHGIDLRAEQIEANEQQRTSIAPEADITWHCGDSNVLLDDAPEADLVFSCPPYGDLEVYSDNPDDLSTMSFSQFLTVYQSIIYKAVARLKNNRFAAFVVGEYRESDGSYVGFVPATCAAFMLSGAAFYNEAILVTAVGSLPIRVTKQFATSRKMGKTHQNVLVFCKGDPKIATDEINKLSEAVK